jgi:hypothetical protein
VLDTEVGYAEKFIKNVFQKLYKIQPSGLLKTAMDHGDNPREPLFLPFLFVTISTSPEGCQDHIYQF